MKRMKGILTNIMILLGVAILLVVTSCSSVKFGWDPECQCQIKKEF